MNEGRVQYALILHFFSSRVLHIPWPGMSLIELRDLIIAVSPRLQKWLPTNASTLVVHSSTLLPLVEVPGASIISSVGSFIGADDNWGCGWGFLLNPRYILYLTQSQ